MDDAGSVEALSTASYGEGSGQDEEDDSFEAKYIFPDGSKDLLRVGRVCKGVCLSRSAFQHSMGRLVRRRGRHCPSTCCIWPSRFVARRRWKSSITSKQRGTMRPFALQEISANHHVLEGLRRQFGPFFGDYRHNLVMGDIISGGGAQGVIHAATWRCDDGCEYDVVVKVLKHQHGSLEGLSQGMLMRMAKQGLDSYAFHGATLIYRATLLRDGRIGLVMRRYSCNLRELIQRRMRGAAGSVHLPFEPHEALHLMHEVASGMRLLHANGVLHRDLNPSNVLVLETNPVRCYVADFECNGPGVSGTGFFRSPEILRGVSMRDAAGVLYQRHCDVYSFAMTCYELCSGLVPLENHRLSDYEFVLEGRRPELPDSITPQVRALIGRCWHQEPSLRPTFDMIVQELDAMIRS